MLPTITPFYRSLRAVAVALVFFVGSHALAQEQTWKINLKNADINELVSQIAAITGKTFVVDPRVKGKVTVISSTSLDEHGVYELFLAVLRVHGFAAIETSGVVRIQQQTLAKQSGSPLDDAALSGGEELVTRVVSAQYVDSNELVKTLRPMIPQYGQIAAITNPNVVIISDHAENIVRLVKLIEKIDVPGDEEVAVIPLKDAWVGNVVELLQKLAPEQLGNAAKGPQSIQIIANARTNSIVLRGKSRPVAEVKKLVAQLDQPATSTGATQVVYLAHADAKNVAEILRALVTGAAGGAAGGGGGANGGGGNVVAAGASPEQINIQADEALNAIVVRADPTSMSDIVEIVNKLDVRRTQVLIEAAIVEISLDKSLNYGVDFAGVNLGDNATPLISTALSPTLGAIIKALQDSTTGPVPIGAVSALTSPGVAVAKLDPNGFSFAAVLQAISTSSNANLLSTPSILTLDNEEAKILVGQSVPFRTGTFTTTADGANNPFTTIQRQDVGITLTVTPHIPTDGTAVRLEVAQEVSNLVLSSLAAVATDTLSDVVTNKRTIQTTVLAEDKQTIVLGGLIEDDIQDTKKKVPLLGDIPWLGQLFRNTEKQHTKRNLLVFLRPTVLHTADDVAEATNRKYENVWEIEVTSKGGKPSEVLHPPLDSIYDGRPQ